RPQPQCPVQAVDGIGRINVGDLQTVLAGRLGGGHHVPSLLEDANEEAAHAWPPFFPPAGPATPLISAMAIIGRKRQNSRKQVKNRPKLPSSVAISTSVGASPAAPEGRKPRPRDVTMMMKRSNHMPTLTSSDSTNTAGNQPRTRLNHSSCGTSTLQPTISQ